MKKATFIIASLTMLFTTSCKEETEKTVEKTTVIETQVEAPTKTTEETDGTSVSVDKNGIEFSTKDGDNKTKVEVKDDGGSVNVKK